MGRDGHIDVVERQLKGGTAMLFDVDWNQYTHQQLFDMLHNSANLLGEVVQTVESGLGVAASQGAQDTWSAWHDEMLSAQQDIDAALHRAGAAWQGSAADSTHTAVTPFSQWAQDGQAHSKANATALQDHTDAYLRARNAMPEPPPSPQLTTPTNLTELLNMQNDQHAQEAMAQQLKQHAVEIMTAFAAQSNSAATNMGAWSAAPQITPSIVATAPNPMPTWHGGQQHVPARTAPTRTPTAVPDQGTPPQQPGPVHTSDWQPPAPQSPDGGPAPVGTEPIGTPPPIDNGPIGTPPPIAITVLPTDPIAGPISEMPLRGGRPAGLRRSGPTEGGAPAERAGGVERVGPPAEEGAAAAVKGAANAEAVERRATALGPIGTGQGRPSEKDEEHFGPEYLRSSHEDFWDSGEHTAPPVIGE
jgi:hypothetical protein